MIVPEPVPDVVVPNSRVAGTVIAPVRVPEDRTMVKGTMMLDPVMLVIEKLALKEPVASGMPGLNVADPPIVIVVLVIGPVRAVTVIVVLVVAACAPAQTNRVKPRNADVRNIVFEILLLHVGQPWRTPLRSQTLKLGRSGRELWAKRKNHHC